ncbi:MAG: hypothetical protein M0R03_18120 [Novosphingobium sp.]|nr:hypothetical protein [Novosphingobium sp.]
MKKIDLIVENAIAICGFNTDKKELEKKQKMFFSELIEKNIKAEAEARMMYYELMQYITDEKDIETLEEIISDELNHTMLLNKMLKKYSKIPMAKD